MTNENTEAVEFEEDGETIQIEIDDGGAAANEYSSEDELNATNSQEENAEKSSDLDLESDPESGELAMETDDEVDESGTGDETRSPVAKRKKAKLTRRSVEDQLSSMSHTLSAMKELLMKKGIMDLPDHTHSKRKSTGAGTKQKVLNNQSNSDTTIYQNVLEKVDENEANQIVVDPEISFKKRDSSSSEEGRIDTSDEMMEINCNKFIADCAAEVNRCKQSYQEQTDGRQHNQEPGQSSDEMIREAEAAKIRMIPTSGNYDGNILPIPNK